MKMFQLKVIGKLSLVLDIEPKKTSSNVLYLKMISEQIILLIFAASFENTEKNGFTFFDVRHQEKCFFPQPKTVKVSICANVPDHMFGLHIF